MNNATNPNISRRTFIEGTAAALAAAGITMSISDNGVDLAFAEGVVDKNAPIEKRYTFCDMCNQVPKCGLTACVQDGHVIRVESRVPHSSSPACLKGLATIQQLYDPNRLLYPIRRTNPKGTGHPEWERISWDEALTTIASELNRVKEQYGPDAVLFYTGDPKEPQVPQVRLARLFGSSTMGDGSCVCATATFMCSRLVYGMSAISMGADPSPETGVCFICSRNGAWATPNLHAYLMDLKEEGVKFIVVDPRLTPTAMNVADLHIQLRPGTDGALLLGIMHILIRDDLYDHDFIENWTIGFDKIKEVAAEYTPEKVSEITWVPVEKIEACVKMLVDNPPMTFMSSASGIAHTSNCGHSLRLLFMLPAFLGSVDVLGGHKFGGRPLDFAGSAGCYCSTPAFRLDSIYNESGMKQRRFDKDDFPAWAFLNPHMQMAKVPEYIKEGKIKAALLTATNLMMWPQTKDFQEAIGSLEFASDTNYFMNPWTHDYVDIVLPAASCYERMAPLGIYGTTVYYRDPVIPPIGDAKEDWQITLELGCKMGFEEECFGGSVEKALEYIMSTSSTGVSLQDLRDHMEDGYTFAGAGGGAFSVQGTDKKKEEKKAAVPQSHLFGAGKYTEKKYEKGMLRPDKKPGFTTLSGKVEFDSEVLKKCGMESMSVPVYEEPIHSPLTAEGEDKNYPLVLCAGPRQPFFTHSLQRDLPYLNQFFPEPVIKMHPKDAEARGISEGDRVRIFNQFGEVFMKAELTNMMLPGVVDVFHGWPQADINLLIPREYDPITAFSPYRAQLCEVQLV